MRPSSTRPIRLRLPFSLGLISLATMWATGCGTGFVKGFPSSITSPSTAVRVTQNLQLGNQSAFTGSPMEYWVNGIRGGNATLGTVDANGVYTAPAITPLPDNTVTITALATAFPNDTPGSVKLAIWNPIPVIAAVTPTGLTEGSTTISVKGSKFIYGAHILWNGAAIPTTYVSSTQLAATISAPTPGNYPLTVLNPDPGAASATPLSEAVGPGQVVLAFPAGRTTSVRVSHQLNLSVNVTGTSNTGVTWLLNGSTTGNAQIGTITVNPDGSVTYSAPAVVPIPSNIVSLTATSVDNPKVSLSQNLQVMNPIPTLASATPMAIDPGPATVVLTGANFIQGAQVLVNGSPVDTTFNTGGQLTATFNPQVPGKLDLQILNPSPGPATSGDLIASVNGTPPTPPVTPEDASRFLAQATFGPTDPDIPPPLPRRLRPVAQRAVQHCPHPPRPRRRSRSHPQQPALPAIRRPVQRLPPR